MSQQQTSHVYSQLGSNQVFPSPLLTSVAINDFSPEWDYVTGGSKVLICTSATFEHCLQNIVEEQKFSCHFENMAVPLKMVQPGVFRCNAPAFNEPGFVALRLYYEGRPLCIAPNYFEYRDLPFKLGMKRDRETADPLLTEDDNNNFDQNHSQQNKVRLVERVTYIQ